MVEVEIRPDEDGNDGGLLYTGVRNVTVLLYK